MLRYTPCHKPICYTPKPQRPSLDFPMKGPETGAHRRRHHRRAALAAQELGGAEAESTGGDSFPQGLAG